MRHALCALPFGSHGPIVPLSHGPSSPRHALCAMLDIAFVSVRMNIHTLSPSSPWRDKWDTFVTAHPLGSVYHLSPWQQIFDENCGRGTEYLLAEDNGAVKGILPLVSFRSFLFGSFFVSLPWTNYGGLLSESEEASRLLVDEAVNLGKRKRAKMIELHSVGESPSPLVAQNLKVSMRLELPANPEDLWRVFPAKLRSQIRRPEKDGLYAEFGGVEKLDDFYSVFARNMRDLGTPAFPQSFFRKILETFEVARICCVYADLRPVAAGFLIAFKDRLEIPWASSLRSFNKQSPNMLLYWQCIKFACEQSYTYFDFGRSTPNGPHFRFKAQWGAQPVPLNWHYWQADDRPFRRELSPENPKYRAAIRLWKWLPFPFTRIAGPVLARSIP